MDLIKHTYSLQWVGPFSYEEYKEYIADEDTLTSDLFNLYYFEVQEDGRHLWKHYLGIHSKNDGIEHRLNSSHEHLGPFVKNGAKNVRIWLASFAREKDQTAGNIDIVETLFIKAYEKDLDLNTKKKKSLPSESVCVLNMFYGRNEKLTQGKCDKPAFMDHVLVYLSEAKSFLHGGLSKMR